MGVYDSTDVCKLFGNYLFQALSKLYKKKTLYWNDRLEVFKNENQPESEKLKNSIQSRFWENKLKLPTRVELGRTCNCINMPQCSLDQKCLSNNNLCQANVTPLDENLENKVYCSICETRFDLQYINHEKSFTYKKHKSDTELSKGFWKIKRQ